MSLRIKNKQSGFLTLEILLAITILIFVLSGAVLTLSGAPADLSPQGAASVVSGTRSLGIDSQANSEALRKVQELLESEQAQNRLDFNLVNPSPHSYVDPADPDGCPQDSISDGIYSKKICVAFKKDPLTDQPDYYIKKVKTIITWKGGQNRSEYSQNSTLVTNPEAAAPGGSGDTCASMIIGDWTHPQAAIYEFGRDLLNDISSGFPVSGIQAYRHKLYVTVNNEHGNSPGTFFIFDISNPGVKPILLSPPLFDNNPNVGVGLNAVALDGNGYAYVASAYNANFTNCVNPNGANKSCGQMQIIDVANPALPEVKYTFKVPGVTGNTASAKSIFYKDGYIYLGLAAAGSGNGPEFQIINVQNPLQPVQVGSWPAPGNSFNNAINAILVKDNYAYLAHPTDPSSPYFEQLTVLDISNPSNPQRIGGFYYNDAIGGNGKSLYLVGNQLFLGRTASNISYSADAIPELFIINGQDPAAIPAAALGSLPLETAKSVKSLIIRDYLAFLITNSQLQIWNIGNLAHIYPFTPNKNASEFLTLPPGSGSIEGTAADCEGDNLFIGSLDANDKGYLSVIKPAP